MMELVSCGNVTDKGIIALHRLRLVTVPPVADWERTKEQRLNCCDSLAQEPGVSVPQRPAGRRRQAEDGGEAADGAAAAGHHAGPGLSGTKPPAALDSHPLGGSSSTAVYSASIQCFSAAAKLKKRSKEKQ